MLPVHSLAEQNQVEISLMKRSTRDQRLIGSTQYCTTNSLRGSFHSLLCLSSVCLSFAPVPSIFHTQFYIFSHTILYFSSQCRLLFIIPTQNGNAVIASLILAPLMISLSFDSWSSEQQDMKRMDELNSSTSGEMNTAIDRMGDLLDALFTL